MTTRVDTECQPGWVRVAGASTATPLAERHVRQCPWLGVGHAEPARARNQSTRLVPMNALDKKPNTLAHQPTPSPPLLLGGLSREVDPTRHTKDMT